MDANPTETKKKKRLRTQSSCANAASIPAEIDQLIKKRGYILHNTVIKD